MYSSIKGTLVFFNCLNYTLSIILAKDRVKNKGFTNIDTLPSIGLPLLPQKNDTAFQSTLGNITFYGPSKPGQCLLTFHRINYSDSLLEALH